MTPVKVTYTTSDEWGKCHDCSSPAAYFVANAFGRKRLEDNEHLRCPVCAAECASDGYKITHLTPNP